MKHDEILVSKIINNNFTEGDKKDPLFPIAKAWAKEIRKDIKNIKRCEYKADDYSDRGDLVIYNPKRIYIELKLITSSTSGKGTLANTSQDTLKEYHLIQGIPGWKEWRENNKYESKIIKLLNSGITYSKKQKEKIFREEKVLLNF